MQRLLWPVLVFLLSWPSLGMAGQVSPQGDFIEFQQILDSRCSKCHTRGRIEQAMAQGKGLQQIQQRMLKLGAQLSSREQEVLGIFWPLQERGGKKDAAAKRSQSDPLAEYREVLQARCTGCHSLERVEQALAQDRPLESLMQLMLKRGAVLTEADRKVLGTFWGKPLR